MFVGRGVGVGVSIDAAAATALLEGIHPATVSGVISTATKSGSIGVLRVPPGVISPITVPVDLTHNIVPAGNPVVEVPEARFALSEKSMIVDGGHPTALGVGNGVGVTVGVEPA